MAGWKCVEHLRTDNGITDAGRRGQRRRRVRWLAARLEGGHSQAGSSIARHYRRAQQQPSCRNREEKCLTLKSLTHFCDISRSSRQTCCLAASGCMGVTDDALEAVETIVRFFTTNPRPTVWIRQRGEAACQARRWADEDQHEAAAAAANEEALCVTPFNPVCAADPKGLS